MVYRSNGIRRTRELAQTFCETARHAIRVFPDTDARAGLDEVLNMVLTRNK